MTNKIPAAAVDLIKRWEVYKGEPYIDNGGGLAIGYGHNNIGPPKVTPDMRVTEEEATAILMGDLEYLATILAKWVHVDLNDNEYGALLSLIFNIGAGHFKSSRVLSLINDPTIQYNRVKAAIAFLEHNKALSKETNQPVILVGLTARRITEAALFLTKP